MATHFLLRVGDGDHFRSSSSLNTWGVTSSHSDVKGFLKIVKEGDLLWFVQSKSKGRIIGVSTFVSMNIRETGPLIAVTPTNEELGWTKKDGDWDTEIHYKNLYHLSEFNLLSKIKSPLVIRQYSEKCKIDLPNEYKYIVRYVKSPQK